MSTERALHLVDIENLIGSTAFDCHAVCSLRSSYQAIAGVSPADQVVVASSHLTAPSAWFGWPGARRLVRSGSDGADLALLDVIEYERLAARFQRIVVASGDGIFAAPSARLQVSGCSLTVVSRCPTSLSRQLRFAVRDVRFLETYAVAASAERVEVAA